VKQSESLDRMEDSRFSFVSTARARAARPASQPSAESNFFSSLYTVLEARLAATAARETKNLERWCRSVAHSLRGDWSPRLSLAAVLLSRGYLEHGTERGLTGSYYCGTCKDATIHLSPHSKRYVGGFGPGCAGT